VPRPIQYILLAISLLFTAAGIGMVVTGAPTGWPALLFFGMCAAVFAGQLWPQLVQQASRSPADILGAYPGPVELRTARLKTLLLMLGAAVFAGVVIWMLLSEPREGWRAWLLWSCAVLIALSVPALLVVLVRGGGLVLTAQGFEIRHVRAPRMSSWQDVGPFEVVRLPPAFTPLVVYDDAGAADGALARANAALMGRTSGLPDSYGLPHEELAALLNAWRERALSGR
jgi:hypothetical protein